MLRKRSTAIAPSVNNDSDDRTTAATPNAEQRPDQAGTQRHCLSASRGVRDPEKQ